MKSHSPLKKAIVRGTARMFQINEPTQSRILLETAYRISEKRNPKLAATILSLLEKVGTEKFTELQRYKASIACHKAMSL